MTKDGSVHFGRLELMTWRGADRYGHDLGFAGVQASEEAEERREFEGTYGGDE